MFDINFFKNSYNIKSKIISNELSSNDIDAISKELEFIRDKNPTIFNIETTNYCNMKCVMCARTIYMKRKNIWISDELFEKLLEKVKPYTQNKIDEFWKWLKEEAKQDKNEVSENGFYFSIVSKHLILHGFGEPFLDKNLIKRIEACKTRNIPTYFSCTPATMTIEKATKAMEAGLGVLKFSLDAMDDDEIKKIRGPKANYNESIQKILKLIKIKKEKNLKTVLVPCMISMKTNEKSLNEQQAFLNFWKEYDVFAYIKSQDNRWLLEQDKNLQNKSHYAKQYCEYPWTSLTVMADGKVVPCTQISNHEIILGDVNKQTLEEIWNSKEYKEFREMHISGKFPKNHKCNKRCDQVKLYEYLKKE
jgi:radical SAM protein with 4Fe4S-binding SPASM domain